MKSRPFFFVLLFSFFCCLTVTAQQKVIAKFHVTNATHNGKDVTPRVLQMGVYTVFYLTEDEELYMANFAKNENTQSWGPIYNYSSTHSNETRDEYESDTFTFNWGYTNSYDDKRGTCTVKLSKIFKPQGVVSQLTMITESLDVTVYTGYMEGTINFNKFR